MNKRRLGTIVVAGLAVIAAMSLALSRTEAETKHHQPGKMAKMDMKGNVKPKACSLDRIHSERLPAVLKSIDKAIKAVESGDSKTVLDELHKAKKMVAAIHKAIGKQVKPKFTNNRCPIMGTPIEPDKITKDLIREYKGQKIALCCANCPPKWDKLTDAEKEAKLAEAKTNQPSSSKQKH